MDCAPFLAIVAFGLEYLAGVYRAYFVVSANAHLAVDVSHPLENTAREYSGIRYLRQATQFAAANAQVEDKRVGSAQVRFNYAPNLAGVASQPFYERAGIWACWQAAGMAKRVVSQPRMYIQQLFKQRPRGLLADGQIVIMRLALLPVGRVDYTDA